MADDYSKTNFKKSETQDANGVVSGSFTIALPDGRIQTTRYEASPRHGYRAQVSYQGQASHPSNNKEKRKRTGSSVRRSS